jgi:hypothetical protein
MSKASEQHIAANEALIATSRNPRLVQQAKENVDLWLSTEGKSGRYGTALAYTAPVSPKLTPPVPGVGRAVFAASPRDDYDRAATLTERTARIIELTGVSQAEALFRAERAIAVERDEPTPFRPVEDMSIPELKAYIADPANRVASEAWLKGKSVEEHEADRQESDEWADGLTERMQAKAAARGSRQKAEFAREASIAEMVKAGVSREVAQGMAPSLESLLAASPPVKTQAEKDAEFRSALQQALDLDAAIKDGQ